MDVDEFLDRELSDLGLQTGSAEKSDSGSEVPQIKEQFESSPLFEHIKNSLSKGGLEEAEQSYVQLWRILMEQKLKWNSELYEQLSILTRQFSSALNFAYNDVRKKADHINELVSRARAALREGKKDMPFKIYSEIEEINNSIPNVFFEEKRLIQEQIMDFYKELSNTTDNELIKRVSALIQEINQIIENLNFSIRSNDMINAIVSYNKCIGLYNQVPEGFLRHKNSIGMRLLDAYKTISIYSEISNLQKQLNQTNQHIQSQQQSMQAGKYPQIIERKERAKKHIEKGAYNEASKEIEEVLKHQPNDAEARAIYAKIKTLQ